MSRDFSAWIDKGFFALLSFVSVYVAGQIKDLSESVNQLNAKLSGYMERSNVQEKTLQDHESRIRILEKRR